MISYDKTLESKEVVHFEEVLELYSDLVKLDPPHSQFYKDEHSLVLLQQVNASSLLYFRSKQIDCRIFYKVCLTTSVEGNLVHLYSI